MVNNITKTIQLTSLSDERNALIKILVRKIGQSKVSMINTDISKDLKIDQIEIMNLINAIESKLKKCEMLYFSFFQDMDHDVLSGRAGSLPISSECIFIDGVAKFKEYFEVDDRAFYQEIIDYNFQVFILILSSLYENIVKLIEFFLKKIVLHGKKNPPKSIPMGDFIECLKTLISLGYRKDDHLHQCIKLHGGFFDKYLELVNNFRNRFIHGYSKNLKFDGPTYVVETFGSQRFSTTSPEVNVDLFVKALLDNTRIFLVDLFQVLCVVTKAGQVVLPA